MLSSLSCLLLYYLSLIFFTSLCRSVSVRFAKQDFGFVNETEGSFFPLTVEKLGENDVDFTVIVQLDDVTGDFLGDSWTILFERDTLSVNKTAYLFVTDDDFPEKNETFNFSLSVSSVIPVAIEEPSSAHVTILANDDAYGVIGFESLTPIQTTEQSGQNTSLSLNLIRERGSFGNVSVLYQVKGGETDTVQDLSPLQGTVIIGDGVSHQTLQLYVLDDKLPENDEEYRIELVEAYGGAMINRNASIATVIIEGNDSPLRFSRKQYIVEEREATLEVVVFRGLDERGESRVGPDDGTVYVEYQVVPGSATARVDYNVPSSGSLVFMNGQHRATLEIYIKDDDLPELSENFTIQLVPGSINGDAIIVEPSRCLVVIESNDNAEGVLAIDFTNAKRFGNKTYFVINEDKSHPFLNLSLIRRGGSFSTVSVQWMVQMEASGGTDIFDVINPISGSITFEPGQNRSNVSLTIFKNSIPQEAKLLTFKILKDSLQGGAILDPPMEALIVIADSDDVYGVFSLNKSESFIQTSSEPRSLMISIVREGGLTGEVVLQYTVSYYPPGSSEALPGVLSEPTGSIVFDQNQNERLFLIEIESDSFLETDSTFEIKINSVELINKNLLIPSQTPSIGVKSIILNVTEENANGEIGFVNNSTLEITEPELRPRDVALELQRQGLSGDATVQVSYRSDNGFEEDKDYVKGPNVVTFEPGQRSKTIILQILPDNIPELEETLTVRLDSVEPANQKLNRHKSIITLRILENDNPGGVFHFDVNSPRHFVIEEEETQTVNVVVERDKGDLAQRMVAYDVIPDGSRKFYGVPEILLFPPGVRKVAISLVPRDDEVPELNQTFILELQSYGNPPSIVSDPSTINVTILANDNPHGVFIFGDEADSPRLQAIEESTSSRNFTAYYRVYRIEGVFGDVSVEWRVIPNNTNDVMPTTGTLHFTENQTESVIAIQSSQDDLPESLKEYTIILFNATGGAKIQEEENSTLLIEPNDKEISFGGSNLRRINEGSKLELTIYRKGSGSDSTTIRYRTTTNDSLPQQRRATPNVDYKPVSGDVITFPPGVLDIVIEIQTYEDEIPEDDESFIVELYDATGDYVAYGNDRVEVLILKNDDAGGIFSLAPPREVKMKERSDHNFTVQREKGMFGEVGLKWTVSRDENSSIAESSQNKKEESVESEFLISEGEIYFEEDEREKFVSLFSLSDDIPEYDEHFVLMLDNITDGDGMLTSELLSRQVRITIEKNDYPHGLLGFKNLSLLVSEDGNNDNNITFEVDRSMGNDGFIETLWQLRPYNSSLPTSCHDLLLGGVLLDGAAFVKGRLKTETKAVKFIPGSQFRSRSFKLRQESLKSDLSISLWLQINIENEVEEISSSDVEEISLISIYDSSNTSIISSTVTHQQSIINSVIFTYRDTTDEEQSVSWNINKNISSLDWSNFVWSINEDQVVLYMGGINQGNRSILSIRNFSDDDQHQYFSLIGFQSDQLFNSAQFTMQDVFLYDVFMTSNQTEELYNLSLQNDIVPKSGYLTYKPQQRTSNSTLHVVDDLITEDNELYLLVLLDSTGGAEINEDNSSMVVTVLKSDNANGLFGFSSPCQPVQLEEGQIAVCHVSRSRGMTGNVTVEWKINITKADDAEDFVENQGTIDFVDGQIENYFNVTVKIEGIPEIEEQHNIVLTQATSLDGSKSSAFYSGASIDDSRKSTVITILANENPNGILQFTSGSPPEDLDEGKIPEELFPPTLFSQEEQGDVTLIVERAGGWFGHVTCEWRTRDGTAVSRQLPKDFEPAAGTIEFEDGQGYAEINVQLLDDDESELEKYFFVELSSPTGGAILNNASKIKVVIEPSDDAFGIFEFNQTSSETEEPTVGIKQVQISIIRKGGDLGESIVSWKLRNNQTNDVSPVSGHLNFTQGQISNTIVIDVISDNIPEFNETIRLYLDEVSQGSIGVRSSFNLLILSNDDPRGVLSFDPLSTTTRESDGNATLTIRRSGGLAGTIRVGYATMDNYPNRNTSEGIASPALDYKQLMGTVLMKENQTSVNISVPIFNDDIPETNEVFFVELVSVELVSSGFQVPNSPRLGNSSEIIAEVDIEENDSPHGILELSLPTVRIEEDVSDQSEDDKNFLFVVRKLGSFGDVTVGFNVLPGSAREKEDYNVVSNTVTLLDRETKKAIPVHIVNDFTPEGEEDFIVELMPNSVTGGAEVGSENRCKVIIGESDDPYGLFSISTDIDRIEEPASGRGVPITFTVTRHNGVKGVVELNYEVNITSAPSAAPNDDENVESLADSGYDVDVRKGSVYFLSKEVTQTFIIKVLPDDLPEDDELIIVTLEKVLSHSKGRIDSRHDQVQILVPANDRPYGDVSLGSSAITSFENDTSSDVASVTVIRSGGLYGTLRVIYTTSEIDVVSEIMEIPKNLLNNYLYPKIVHSIADATRFQTVDILSSENPLFTCAEACLRERICRAFLYQNSSFACRWLTHDEVERGRIVFANNDVTHPPSYLEGRFSFYEKNRTKTSLIYNSQARSDLDFYPLSGASVLLHPGQSVGFINISILPDNLPELEEFFKVTLLRLQMVDFSPAPSNIPKIMSPSTCRVTIDKNDYPYGLFVLKIPGRNAENESFVAVEEKPKLSLELVVERKGGSIGSVTVDWAVVGGTAARNSDFTGDDATLRFAHGETSKIISVTIMDDAVPEPDETIQIQLLNPTGGSVLDTDHDQLTIVVLANDVVGGVVGFSTDSKSVIAEEGDNITLALVRSQPALGHCQVSWEAQNVNGHDVEKGINITLGTIDFESGETRGFIFLHINTDDTPEAKERYKIVLVDIESNGVGLSGSATINTLSHEAEISIQESNNPHGVFQFAPDSQRINIKEDENLLKIYVTRQFGSIGIVRIYYDVIPGTLSTVNPDIGVAQPGSDFTSTDDRFYITFNDGNTSVPIVMNVIDDDVPELIEIFHVNLTGAVLMGEDGYEVIPLIPPTIDSDSALSQVVIDANDGTKGEVSFNTSSKHVVATEGSTITLNVDRNKGAYGEVSVFIYPHNEDAVLGLDYDCKPETLVFPDSQRSSRYVIKILDDATPEGNESFVVLLNNPSSGLELGNITSATVTIISNDDAHGRISFNNDPVLYIDEAEPENISQSIATLIVKRSPPDGVFGEVSVQFRVDEITANGDVMPSRPSDISPTSGFVTIENGVTEAILELRAQPDELPELDRRYRVTLFDPQQGATLASNQTTCEIVIHENDSPFGYFRVYPHGVRNGSNVIRLNEENNKALKVDVVRSQGLLGYVPIVLETSSGSANPVFPSNLYSPILVPFQTFKSSPGVWFHDFNHKGSNYLIYLTTQHKSPISSKVGSSGTLPSLTSGIHSTLYFWGGTYTPIQTIETDGASCATSFTVEDVLYVFITNKGSDGRREVISRLYMLTEEGNLQVLQDITTKGADYVVHFHSNHHYIVIANSVDNNRVSSIDSSVFQFNVSKRLLFEIQSLPTRGASGLNSFHLNNNIYLAIANRFDSDSSTSSGVSSVIYKWNSDSKSFINPVNVDVSHAVDVQSFNVEQKSFLVFSTFDGTNPFTRSANSVRIFQVFTNDIDGNIILRRHQNLNVTKPNRISLLKASIDELNAQGRLPNNYIKNNSVQLLMVASLVQSQLFIFNFKSMLYAPLCYAMPALQMNPYVINDSYNSTAVVAVATNDASARPRALFSGSMFKALDYSRITSSAIYDIFNLHKTDIISPESIEGDYFGASKTLLFRPGESVRTVTINLRDDDLPENNEEFKVILSNLLDRRAVVDDASQLDVIIEANDDAFGVIGFDQESVRKSVEETSQDNVITLNVVRHISSYGRVAVDWLAEGSIDDISPTFGQIIFEDNQSVASIQLTILSDDEPEVEEVVAIQLDNPRLLEPKSTLKPLINDSSSTSVLRILTNDSPHGVVRWAPNSLQTVVKEPDSDIDALSLVTLEIVREQGALGDIEVYFKTQQMRNLPEDLQATPELDYRSRDSSLIMRENSTRASVSFSILPDDDAEDIESFFVVIYNVTLIGQSRIGGKPGIGQGGSNIAEVTIDENDNARGFIQFNVTRNNEGTVDAYELPRLNNTLKLPLIRLVGTARSVGVEWVAKPVTAQSGDFFPSSGNVQFEAGSNSAEIEIFITDDDLVEFMESFTVQLIGVTGGAKLGGDLVVTVSILPNDSPSGMFGFLEKSQTVQESSSANDPAGVARFTVKRFQGSDDEISLTWQLKETARNDLSPMSGRLIFPPGVRSQLIVLRTLPDQELEGEETYQVKLVSATGKAEISPVAKTAKIIIEADPGAAGRVSLETSTVYMSEPEESKNGSAKLLLRRGPSAFGQVVVEWQIKPSDQNTFRHVQGRAVFDDGENETYIVIDIVDDDIPELSENYVLRLGSVSGGATLSPSKNTCFLKVVSSDNPHGVFSFSQPLYHVKEGGNDDSVTSLRDFVSYASLTVLRKKGTQGKVSMNLETNPGSAQPNIDYYPINERVVFNDGEKLKRVSVEIINDDIPEGPTDFFVNATDILLLSNENLDFDSNPLFNLSVDTPPILSNPSWAVVRIAKSDGAEGVIEFGGDGDEIRVREEAGDVLIPLIRHDGSYGNVFVVVNSINQTAQRNVDFLLPSSGVTVYFADGQTKAEMSVGLLDDDLIEHEEKFTLALTDASGGARIGSRKMLDVVILKSEFPNGVIRFLGPTLKVIENPTQQSGKLLTFTLERFGGNQLPVNIHWKIIRTKPFYAPTTRSTPIEDDISTPTRGVFHFDADRGGERQIFVRILPENTDQESEEKFSIVIEDPSPAEISPEKGNVTITVLKKGHPNGVVQFGSLNSDSTLSTRQVIDEPNSGAIQVIFPITRSRGSIGQINVTWSLTSENQLSEAYADDVGETEGYVLMYDSQLTSEIVVSVLNDEKSEIDETFLLTLTSVDGGAEINMNRSMQQFVVRANDYPHGVFSLKPENQEIFVTDQMKRLLRVNITRDRGSFDNVVVGFSVEFNNPVEGVSYLTTNTGSVIFAHGVIWNVEEIEISSSVFLPVHSTFIVRLTNVEFIGSSLTIEPIISNRYNRVLVQVDDVVGNPDVGFESNIANVDVDSNTCILTLVRNGLYGDVAIQWKAGFPDRFLPPGVVEGTITPSSDVVNMEHATKTANFTISVLPQLLERASFAVYVSRVISSVGGGAKINKSRYSVEIDPHGAVRFSTNSQKLSTAHDIKTINLTVERLYGNQNDIQVGFSLVSITAVPNIDYYNPVPSFFIMKNGENRKNITVLLAKSDSTRQRKFLVNLTSVFQTQRNFKDASPRLVAGQSVSHVTLLQPRDAHGYISLRDVILHTPESASDGSNVLLAMINMQRTEGAIGDAYVMLTTIGDGDPFRDVSGSGLSRSAMLKIASEVNNDRTQKAIGNRDYEIRSKNVSFSQGIDTVSVAVVILNDDVSEPEEAFFAYLHSPRGGAQINPEKNLIKIVIEANDFPNGLIGFVKPAYLINEKSSASSTIAVRRSHAFGNVTIYWRALVSPPSLNDDVVENIQYSNTQIVTSFSSSKLAEELIETEGSVTCPASQLTCSIPVKVKDDEVAEFEKTFFLEIYHVTNGAKIDVEHKVANVTIGDSDFPRGLFQFSPNSRLPATSKNIRSVELTIERMGGASLNVLVRYKTRQITRLTTIAGVSFYPAVANSDFVSVEGTVRFVKNQRLATVTINLLPGSRSANPLPQIFQVVLVDSTQGSELSDVYSVANVTIFENNDVMKSWTVYEALQQDLTVASVQGVIEKIDRIADENINKNQVKVFHESIKEVLRFGRKERLSEKSFEQMYQVFCKLLDPSRTDAVRGYSDFGNLIDQFALCLTTDTACATNDASSLVMSSCPYALVQSSNWYPELVNGYVFTGTKQDYFKMSNDVLDSNRHGAESSDPKCFQLYFVELSSSIWFEVKGEKAPMSNKAFSVGVDQLPTHFLSSPVRYRVYTNDARISPQGAECVLWNQASSRWLSTSQGSCRVVDDSSNYVDCECDHMSVYAARGPTDNLASYNEATYASNFITLLSCFLTLISNCFCAGRRRFTTRLFLQMMVACGVTQIFFVTSAMTSKFASEDSCAALALIFHYFWLSQFTWMFVLALNLLQLLSFNSTKTEQKFFWFFLIGWGIPAVVVVSYVVVIFALGVTSLNRVYGDVFDNGEMCAIINPYGAIFSAVFPACLCVLFVVTIFYHLYQKEESWKKFDDVWIGKNNLREIQYLCWFFFFLTFTWLFGGLHLAYGFLWMLVLFVVFNFLLGLFVFVVYFILRCSLLSSNKQLYEETLDKPGDRSNEYQTASFGTLPSITEDVLNKNSGNLIKIETDWAENDGNMLAESIIGLTQTQIKTDSSDFDDLMSALGNAAEEPVDLQDSTTRPKLIEAMNKGVEPISDEDAEEDTPGSQYVNNQTSPYDLTDTHL